MRAVRMRAIALVVVAGLVGSACGIAGLARDQAAGPGPSSSSTPAPTDGPVDTTNPELDEPITPQNHLSGVSEEDLAGRADDIMVAAALDVEAFWQSAYGEAYDQPYQELAGGLWSYDPDTAEDDLPPCPGLTSYDQIAVNAFYCSGVDLIAWDRVGLIEPFISEYGAFAAAVVMAHEFGHAIQARTGDFDTLAQVISELQADCFAGAWVAHVVQGGSDAFQADLNELDVAIAGLIAIRDVPGSSPDDPSAHGSGFDRVSAFADGLFEGAPRCAEYREPSGEPLVVQQVFEAGEQESLGDLPSDELLELLVDDLEDFYQVLFAEELGARWPGIERVRLYHPTNDEITCAGRVLDEDEMDFASYYCVDESTVALDGVGLMPALAEIGDFALGAELARLWALAAQVAQGNEDNSREAFLNADCLTGLYAGDIYFELRPDSDARLSAGDLDEAIISFLAFGGDPDGDDLVGSPFERTDAFRTGFLGSFADCQAYLG